MNDMHEDDFVEEPKIALRTRPGQPVDPPDLTLTLNAAAQHAERLGLPIRLRLQPQLFFAADKTIPSEAQYRSWIGMFWVMEFASATEVEAFRQALDQFITTWTETHR